MYSYIYKKCRVEKKSFSYEQRYTLDFTGVFGVFSFLWGALHSATYYFFGVLRGAI